MRYPSFLMFLLALATALTAGSQDVVVNVNLRAIALSVEDESGRPLIDLTPDNFVVFENGQIKPVAHLSLETQPVALGLVVDRSISIAPVKNKIDRAVMHAIDAARDDDVLFLMTFAGMGKLNVTLTTKHQNIREAIPKLKLGVGSRVYDVIFDSVQYLSTSSAEHKVLLVFTDGADHYSAHTLEEVQAVATSQRIPIYMLGYVGDDSRTWSESGRSQIRDGFEQLARMTGGRAFFSEHDEDSSEVVLQILQRWRYEYRIEFYSSSARAKSTDPQVMLRGPRAPRVIIRSRLPIS
ncbi:MAG TPA: VWA domain-containing protein [Terriglobia bacterium]|nr:VWA domain-containing protein [Terriglobia bacterium]